MTRRSSARSPTTTSTGMPTDRRGILTGRARAARARPHAGSPPHVCRDQVGTRELDPPAPAVPQLGEVSRAGCGPRRQRSPLTPRGLPHAGHHPCRSPDPPADHRHRTAHCQCRVVPSTRCPRIPPGSRQAACYSACEQRDAPALVDSDIRAHESPASHVEAGLRHDGAQPQPVSLTLRLLSNRVSLPTEPMRERLVDIGMMPRRVRVRIDALDLRRHLPQHRRPVGGE